ncbi:DUF4430 domain-containing protein [Salana multivorans]
MTSSRSLLTRALGAVGVALLATATAACSSPTATQEASPATSESASSESSAAESTPSESATPDASGEASGEAVFTYDDGGEQLVSLSYPGETGKTALELLLEHDREATVEGEGEMAFVTGIAGQAADSTSEFWALDVDGQFAEVGAGSLETQDGETITWTLTPFE